MSFNRSKFLSPFKFRTSVFKYLIVFFLWISCVLMTQAFNIDVNLNNAVQYIQKIFLTSNGNTSGTTGILLDGSGGNARFGWTVTMGGLTNVAVLGTNESGEFIPSTSGAIYNLISWFVLSWPQGNTWATGATWAPGDIWETWPQWIQGIQGATWATWTFDGTEGDPIYMANSGNYILSSQTGNWNEAYSRGDHANVGYLTSYDEMDPIFMAASGDYVHLTGNESIYWTKTFHTALNIDGQARYASTSNMWANPEDFASKYYVDQFIPLQYISTLDGGFIPSREWTQFTDTIMQFTGGKIWVNIPWGGTISAIFDVYSNSDVAISAYSDNSYAYYGQSVNGDALYMNSQLGKAGAFHQQSYSTDPWTNANSSVYIQRNSDGAFEFTNWMLWFNMFGNTWGNFIDAMRDGTTRAFSLTAMWDIRQVNTSYHYFAADKTVDTEWDRRIWLSGANLSIQIYTAWMWVEKAQYTP